MRFHPVPLEVGFKILNGSQCIGMGKVAQVPDLVDIEEDLGAEEGVPDISPPFCMELFTEYFQLIFELHVKGCQRLIRVHLDLVGLVLGPWSKVCHMHTCGMLRITEVAAGLYQMRGTLLTAV